MLSKNDLLNKCLTKTSIFKSSVGDIKLRQLTIAETEEIIKIQNDKDKTMLDVIKHTLKKVMVEPEFFTEEEFSQISTQGMNLVYEIYNEVPMVGMTDEERAEHKKKIEDFIKSKNDKIEEEKKRKKTRWESKRRAKVPLQASPKSW